MFIFNDDDVASLLQRFLDTSKQEYYEKEVNMNSVSVDFYLPNGCVKLNYPPRTVIEFVHRLASGTLYQARLIVEKLKQKYDIRAYYIFCEEINKEYLPLSSSSGNDDIIHVIDFKEINKQKKRLFEDDDFWADRRERIKSKAQEMFNNGKNTIFLGAGLSKSMGLPGWDELLMRLLKSLKHKKALSVNDYSACINDSGNDLLVKARYLKSFYNESKLSLVSEIRNVLYEKLNKDKSLLDSVAALIKTEKIDSIITYNYDDLLERELQNNNIPHTPVDRSNRPIPGTLPIHHIHGMVTQREDVDYDSNVVLSEDDYHSLYNDAFHWANVEQLHAFSQTNCFFIGLSLRDPSLRRLLDISFKRGMGEAVHYAYLPRFEYKEPTKAETIFYNMGVNIIWYEDVHELPGMILELVK